MEYTGDVWERVYDEPWTGTDWQEVQVSLGANSDFIRTMHPGADIVSWL